MEPEVVSQIWNMLVEANQASGDLRVSNIYCKSGILCLLLDA